jgi:hypothetical protein
VSDQRPGADTPPPANETLARWGRPLAVAAAAVFSLSSAFPVAAGLARDPASFPPWWGPLDVGIAFALALAAFSLLGLTRGKAGRQAEEASYRAYRVLPHGILAPCVVFLLCGERVSWVNCLPGFAWRAWLLLYTLPAWFAALGARP